MLDFLDAAIPGFDVDYTRVAAGKVIERLSVSQIETFDASTTWGCPRKWWFKHVAKVPDGPPDVAQDTGTKMHKRIERYILANLLIRARPPKRPGRRTALARGEGLQPLELAGKGYIDEVIERCIGVEYHFDGELRACGIPLQGYIDVLLPDEVRDWKSTSDVARYGKTEREVRESVQMTGYSKWFFDRHPEAKSVRNVQVFFQTKRKRYAEKVSCLVTREEVVDRWTKIEGTVKLMTVAAQETDVRKVSACTSKCEMPPGRGCPYKSICHSTFTKDEEMGLLDQFIDLAPAANTVTPPPAPPPASAVEKPTPGQGLGQGLVQGQTYVVDGKLATFLCSTEGRSSFVIPGQPPTLVPFGEIAARVKENPLPVPPLPPVLAPEPVTVKTETFSIPSAVPTTAVPSAAAAPAGAPPATPGEVTQGVVGAAPSTETKPKRGRPRKVITDVAEGETVEAAVEREAKGESAPVVAQQTHRVVARKINLRHELTINLGNYQNAKVGVEVEAEIEGDLETARALLSAQVKDALAKEAAQYRAHAAKAGG